MSTPVLEAAGLTAGYDGVPVVRGLLRFSAGTIAFTGTPLDLVSAAARARRGIAHVPEGRGSSPD